ncbi:hypothetical protein NADFUDRAFT_51943 [Nadsonia fulvescens var. elongata DSM 6958]|uniref:EKC/KEOPS complex subunit GON7 n=1 Tax=Nadsonia fulvescens var. elongata DSM 6958 TaxID=857566 RepID=A0A1E3PJ14_9ASCO|nr:hypothetical protein NADFUDRAFT_51943 [Nadsonia fulvescens var. elongata DSM 6958]
MELSRISASYTSPTDTRKFYPKSTGVEIEPFASTSDDRNSPNDPSDSFNGRLRSDIFNLQSQLNGFLTAKMSETKKRQYDQLSADKEAQEAADLETKMLDGNDDIEE